MHANKEIQQQKNRGRIIIWDHEIGEALDRPSCKVITVSCKAHFSAESFVIRSLQLVRVLNIHWPFASTAFTFGSAIQNSALKYILQMSVAVEDF